MQNVFNNGKQHDIITTMTIKVGIFCGVTSRVFTTVGIVAYVFAKVDLFGLWCVFLFTKFKGCFTSQ
jgi:hypothetical protein